MSLILDQIHEAVAFIQSKCKGTPEAGIILGSGLGNFITEIRSAIEIPYSDIPHFPVSTVEGHSGKLIIGEIEGRLIVAMAGRFHYYEGYSAEQVVFPIRVMKFLGIGVLLISNAAGGVNPAFQVGDLMIIRDHISFSVINPLIGRNEPALGPRFPDLSEPYKLELVHLAKEIGKRLSIHLREGVYYGVTGPTFETRAEYLMIHKLGADAVGMSTVQEVIVAAHMQLPVFAISIITDIGIREEENVITHEDVLQAAKEAEPKLTSIFKELIRNNAI
jgi:purine-nucleoside phosphorylase